MEGFKVNPKMAKNLPCYKEGGSVKYKSRHSEKTEMKEDVAKDKAMIKKAVKMHDTQQHEGKETNLSKLKKGGRMKKEGGCVGRYKSGGGISYGAKKSKQDIKEIAAIKRMKPKVKTGGSDVAKDGGGKTGGADIKTGMKTGSSDVKKEGSVTGSSDVNKDGSMTGGLNNIFKKGGRAKKYAEGGSLKPVDSNENPGLAKLPTHVRNKMGYQKKGGSVKKYADGGMVTAEERARMPKGKLPQQMTDELAMQENIQDREMVAGPLRKLKNKVTDIFKKKETTQMKRGGKACQ